MFLYFIFSGDKQYVNFSSSKHRWSVHPRSNPTRTEEGLPRHAELYRCTSRHGGRERETSKIASTPYTKLSIELASKSGGSGSNSC